MDLSPMFTLNGQVVHVFKSPVGTNKDTGAEYGGLDKVQIIGNIPLKNGEVRKDIITLTTDQGTHLEKAIGRNVSAPVAFFSQKAGEVSYYIPKGHTVTLRAQQTA